MVPAPSPSGSRGPPLVINLMASPKDLARVEPEAGLDEPPPDVRPRNEAELKEWITRHTGLVIPDCAVCDEHQSPWEFFRTIFLDRPSVALLLGSRGSGKSFLSALDTHLTSRWDPRHGTRILGGSKQQSAQIYEAIRAIATEHAGEAGDDSASIAKLLKDGARYVNGSKVDILAASSTSVRGPHVPSLKLDEVDEMDVDIRESAMGMCMGRLKRGAEVRDVMPASVLMTSTCHRVDGPMAKLIERATQGDFPLFTMCAFEVLERCPVERSGPNLERCPDCPLHAYCHDVKDGDTPKAKRSDGHYPIESLIQKLKTTGKRTFEADYLCKLSGSDAAWYPTFGPDSHVDPVAECRPEFDIHLAVDSGVFTGAVLFQVIPSGSGGVEGDRIHVFADYLSEGRGAQRAARDLRTLLDVHRRDHRVRATTDPAGGARTAIGPTVLGEYGRAGLDLRPWPVCKVLDSLALLESFIAPAEGPPKLLVHPRCKDLIAALRNYRRARQGGQWLERPADPQHPAEDLVDALRGGLKAHYPNGRTTAPSAFTRVKAKSVF